MSGSRGAAPSAPRDWRARLPSSYPDHITFSPVEGRGVGMFSRKSFEAGETVLEEKPMFTRPPPEEVAKRAWPEDWEKGFSSIKVQLCFPGEAPTDAKLYANPGMVRSALGFAASSTKVRREILKLWHPPLDSDHPIVEVTLRLARLCIDCLDECKALQVEELQTALLAIEMNLFTGGHIFQLFSRVNHSCLPNTVYIASKDGRRLRALRPIRSGEEIVHSYLGEEQLMPTEHRRRHLWRSKCFHCICERCVASLDPFRDMPCRACAAIHGAYVSGWRVVHKPGVWLRSCPSTDGSKVGFLPSDYVVSATGRMDGLWAEHAEGSWMLTDGAKLGLGTLCTPETYGQLELPQVNEGWWDPYFRYFFRPHDRPDPKYACKRDLFEIEDALDELRLPPHCLADALEDIPYARFQGDCWRCEKCGHEERGEQLLHAERVLGRLAECTFFSPDIVEGTATYQMGKHRASIPLIDAGFLMGAMHLAGIITQVLGHWHWAAQWARILFTDVASSLQNLSNHRILNDEPVRDLKVLWLWLKSLGMAQEPCCWLYSRFERFKYVNEVARFLETELRAWKEGGTPMVQLLPLKNYALEGIVSFG